MRERPVVLVVPPRLVDQIPPMQDQMVRVNIEHLVRGELIVDAITIKLPPNLQKLTVAVRVEEHDQVINAIDAINANDADGNYSENSYDSDDLKEASVGFYNRAKLQCKKPKDSGKIMKKQRLLP